jgi:hypothetical protein
MKGDVDTEQGIKRKDMERLEDWKKKRWNGEGVRLC